MLMDEKVKILNIDLPSSCNLSCEFCYLPETGGSLKISDLEEITSEFPNAQVFNLGGGEPFLNNELLNAVKHIESLGDKTIIITTNATYVPEKILSLPENSRKRISIQASLPAGNSGLYKAITGKDEFENVLHNIRELKQHYRTLINMVVYKRNCESVGEVLGIAQELGVSARINLAIPVGRGKGIEILGEKQLKSLKSFLLVRRAAGFDIESSLLSIGEDNCPVNRCIAAEQFYSIKKDAPCPVDFGIKAYISPDGSRFDCEFLAADCVLAGGGKYG
ncbi:radical SAM protein [Candidatus Pacearchaeota archaeon]|nr:radical SAM protein [Candidatus Pacearchaeota archaeon]